MALGMKALPMVICVAALGGCMAQTGPAVQPAGPVPVVVDGQTYTARFVASENYMLAHVAPPTLSDETGPAIRIGGTAGDGVLAAHVLNAYCTGARDYTVAGAADAVLYGAFGDFFWLDPATGEYVFPREDCAA
jgi:hypothetical protein